METLLEYVSKRAARSFSFYLGSVFAVAVIVYLPCFLYGASPLALMILDSLVNSLRHTPEIQDAMVAQFGLVANPDCWEWIAIIWATFTNCVNGNFGISLLFARPVSTLISERLPNTLLLLTVSGAMAGVRLRRHRSSQLRGGSSVGARSSMMTAVPAFWLGMMLLFGFSYVLPDWTASTFGLAVGMPQYGTISYEVWQVAISAGLGAVIMVGDISLHLILPSLVLSRFIAWSLSGILDSSAERMNDKASLAVILSQHAEDVAGTLPQIVSVAILIEVLFTWRGVGRFLFDCIFVMDVPVLLGCLVSLITISVFAAFAIETAGAVISYRSPLSSPDEILHRLPVVDEVSRAIRAYLLGSLPVEIDITETLPVKQACSYNASLGHTKGGGSPHRRDSALVN
jgi:peptide/nickel transport system permease protein